MRIVIQRVSSARVRVGGETVGQIGPGLLLLIGIRESDDLAVLEWMARKVMGLRIFEDTEGKMNLSLEDIRGSILAVSQFTLYGDARKGNRPSFIEAARPESAKAIYDTFVGMLRAAIGAERLAEGIFQAMMEVELVNDGPVTLILER